MKTNRLLFYDILKAYAIVIVVLGHVIQTFNPDNPYIKYVTDNNYLGFYEISGEDLKNKFLIDPGPKGH